MIMQYGILVILSTLGMSGHVYQKWQYQLERSFNVYLHKKSTSSLTSLLSDCKLVTLGTLGIPGYCHQKLKHQPVEDVDVFLHAKIKVIPHFFLEILQRYCKLVILGTLGMPGHIHQNWLRLLKFNIIETLIFISMQKINLIPPSQ